MSTFILIDLKDHEFDVQAEAALVNKNNSKTASASTSGPSQSKSGVKLSKEVSIEFLLAESAKVTIGRFGTFDTQTE